MTPTQIAFLAIEATKLARALVSQIKFSQLEELPPRVREELLAERDRLNDQWADLAPKG